MISKGSIRRSVNQKVLSSVGISIKKKATARNGSEYPCLTQAITYSSVFRKAFLLMESAVASVNAAISAKNTHDIIPPLTIKDGYYKCQVPSTVIQTVDHRHQTLDLERKING